MRGEFQNRDNRLAFPALNNIGPITEKDAVGTGSAVLHVSFPNGFSAQPGESEITMRF